MAKYQHLHEHAADPHIVELFANCLIDAYEQFIAIYPGKVDFVDAFMAAHNFHKAVIEDLEERTGNSGIWQAAAVATLQEAMER